jgi:hypothetical protein
MRRSERLMMRLPSVRNRLAGGLIFLVAAIALGALPTVADTQSFNTPGLFAGADGKCYARSEPTGTRVALMSTVSGAMETSSCSASTGMAYSSP